MSFSDNFIDLLTIKCFYEGKYNKMLFRSYMAYTDLSLPMYLHQINDYTGRRNVIPVSNFINYWPLNETISKRILYLPKYIFAGIARQVHTKHHSRMTGILEHTIYYIGSIFSMQLICITSSLQLWYMYLIVYLDTSITRIYSCRS